MEHMIFDKRDSQRLADLQRPMLARGMEIIRDTPGILSLSLLVCPKNEEQALAFASNMRLRRELLDELEQVHNAAAEIMRAFVPQYPLVPLSQS